MAPQVTGSIRYVPWMVPPDENEEQPEYLIENARSGRSKCKNCRKTIAKDDLRMGVLVEGPYGLGYMWYHLVCSAAAHMDKVEEAYGAKAWEAAKVPPDPEDLPDLATLREHAVEAEREREEKERNKKVIPYAEVAPSGRSKCKQSGEAIPKGAVRIVLGKEATFGSQTRTSAHAVLPEHVWASLEDPEIVTDPHTLIDELRANSRIEEAVLEEALAAIGEA